MNKEQKQVISKVHSMLNEEEFTSKNDLLEAGANMGWKPVTINFAISQLKKAKCIEEIKNENGEKMFKLNGNEYRTENTSEKIIDTPGYSGYKAKRKNYRRDIPELTPEQESLKEKITANREKLMDKEIIWVTPNGLTLPLIIAGMGDITIRCRMYMENIMESEAETGLLIYIPWHEPTIIQLENQINALLNNTNKHKCFDPNSLVAPAK